MEHLSVYKGLFLLPQYSHSKTNYPHDRRTILQLQLYTFTIHQPTSSLDIHAPRGLIEHPGAIIQLVSPVIKTSL